MEQPSPSKVPSLPGTPLGQVSPERMNRIPQSPSLPQLFDEGRKHHRDPSDVQTKVAFLNNLAGRNSPSPTRQNGSSTTAALQRAILGREEAEAALSATMSQLTEALARERRISERVESLMEDLQASKERQVYERQIFEREVRKARKEAFKASSVLVKTQEDLKDARTELKKVQNEVQHEKHEKDKARQEAFERAYAIAGVTEEMEVLREKLKTAEQDRDAATLELNARLAREQQLGQGVEAGTQTEPVPAPPAPMPCADCQSGVKAKQEPRKRSSTCDWEEILPVELPKAQPYIEFGMGSGSHAKLQSELDESTSYLGGLSPDDQVLHLRGQVLWEKKLRMRADETIHMMNMECQFGICACRLAEKRGEKFIHDPIYAAKQAATKEEQKVTKEVKQLSLPSSSPIVRPDESLEPTAQLEDMTQVLVDANTNPDHFSFATSVNQFRATAPTLRQDQRTLSDPDADLFNLSPPKHPSRPSTAMGVMTLQSPIRLVAGSPRSIQTSHVGSSNVPRKVALNDASSPSRLPARRRSRSLHATPEPVTPVLRSQHHAIYRNVAPLESGTTTTRVPLRGLSEEVRSPMAGPAGTPISREAALAQIRARRDRARSVNLKTAKSTGTPGSARRGFTGVFGAGERGRDVSQASAPGRI